MKTLDDKDLDDEDEVHEEEERKLDKEEKEMYNDDDDSDCDDEDSETLAKDVEIMEDAMEKEVIERAAKKGEPVWQVLFKVNIMLPSFFLYVIFFFFFFFAFDLITLLITFLFQLHKLTYAIKNSTTIILPWWNEIIQQCTLSSTLKKKLTVCKMPWDVTTWWNSTYDMLKFAYIYHDAINKITDDHSIKLHEYELKDCEWKIVEELRDSLKV